MSENESYIVKIWHVINLPKLEDKNLLGTNLSSNFQQRGLKNEYKSTTELLGICQTLTAT